MRRCDFDLVTTLVPAINSPDQLVPLILKVSADVVLAKAVAVAILEFVDAAVRGTVVGGGNSRALLIRAVTPSRSDLLGAKPIELRRSDPANIINMISLITESCTCVFPFSGSIG